MATKEQRICAYQAENNVYSPSKAWKFIAFRPGAHSRKVESFFQTATAKAAAGRQRKFLLRLDYVIVVVVRQHHTTQISCVCTAKKRLYCVPSIVHFHHDYRFQRHCLYDGVKWIRKDGVGKRPGNATGCCSNDICDLEESKRDEPVCMCFQKGEKIKRSKRIPLCIHSQRRSHSFKVENCYSTSSLFAFCRFCIHHFSLVFHPQRKLSTRVKSLSLFCSNVEHIFGCE